MVFPFYVVYCFNEKIIRVCLKKFCLLYVAVVFREFLFALVTMWFCFSCAMHLLKLRIRRHESVAWKH